MPFCWFCHEVAHLKILDIQKNAVMAMWFYTRIMYPNDRYIDHDLDLHCLPRPVCLKAEDQYSRFFMNLNCIPHPEEWGPVGYLMIIRG